MTPISGEGLLGAAAEGGAPFVFPENPDVPIESARYTLRAGAPALHVLSGVTPNGSFAARVETAGSARSVVLAPGGLWKAAAEGTLLLRVTGDKVGLPEGEGTP